MSNQKLALVGLMMIATTAHAQQAKYTRDREVTVNVNLSDRVKPTPAKPGARATKPDLTAEGALAIEGLVGKIRGDQEQLLIDLISQTPDAEVVEKSDYYFRLGELYAKQHRYWRLESVGQAIAAGAAKTSRARRQAEAAARTAAARAKHYLREAVTTYKTLTDNDAFRNYPKMDLALFYYGYTLQGARYLKEARAVYDKLLKNYPSSKYVPEAHLAFADYYFEAGQLADAEARYRMVLKFPRSSAYWYAMYKTGWIQLNLRRFQDALETFFQVAQATRADRKYEVLNRAAKQDFVRAYAEIGKADKAYQAFQRVDRAGAFAMLATLADRYLEQGKSDKAIATYQELMTRAPKHKDVCLWQYDVAHAMLSLPGALIGDRVKEIENLVRLQGALASRRVLPATEAQECHDNAAAMSGELARAYHSEAVRIKNPETLAHAERLYKVYLAGFPAAPDHVETQYFYAELLWSRAAAETNPRLQTELWETAAKAFTDVVKAGKAPAKLVKEAAYAAVLAWKNALDIDPKPQQQVGKLDDPKTTYATVPKPRAIPPRERQLIAAFEVYLRYITDPTDDERVGIKFLEGNLYRRYHHYDQAIPLFEDILAHHRDHETAEYAANLLLDSYNRLKNYPALVAVVGKLSADKPFLEGKPELAERLAHLRIQAMRNAAQDLEAAGKASKDYGKLVACGQAYLDIYNANPEATDNDEILYNALVCYHEGKSVGAAIVAFGLLERYYPRSKLMPRAVGRIGKAYGDVAYYEKAAAKLEQYAKTYAGEDDAFSAASDAVFFQKGTGQDAKAIENTKFFINTFGAKRPREAATAMFSLTSIYEKRGDGDAVVGHLRAYLRRFGVQGGADREVIAHAKIGQTLWAQSCPVKSVDGSCIEIVRERAFDAKRRERHGDLHTQCGPATKSKLTVVARDPRRVAAAMAAFAAATKAYERAGGKLGGDEGGARYYYAQAKLAVADRDFEAYLAKKFPQGLNFDPKAKAIRDRSAARFDAWLADKTRIGGLATRQYEAVLGIKDAASSITAAARLGQISQHFSDALFTAEIPKNVRTGDFADDKIEAFCDRMIEVAEPLEARSLEAYGVCLTKSTELGWFSEWSRLCERELGQIKPDAYPTAAELRGTPTRLGPVVAVEPPIARLETPGATGPAR